MAVRAGCRTLSVFLTFFSFAGSVNSSRCVSTPITLGKPCTCATKAAP